LGKRSEAFQEYLKRTCDPNAGEEDDRRPERVDHSTCGARHAVTMYPWPAGHLLANCIAGHHGELLDGIATSPEHQRATLKFRLDPASYTRSAFVEIPAEDKVAAPLQLPFTSPASKQDGAFAISFFTRMLYSCLIDADRTATEAFCNKEVAAERSRPKPSIAALRQRLDTFLDDFAGKAEKTPVNEVRAEVLQDCRAAAGLGPGFFTLDVPTGGGKTFASLAFALRHAEARGLQRVVVAIPFTSIIDQTADKYREALGNLAELGLLEHQSNIEETRRTRANQLAAENWDAPLIVTTNVQLFESLFASRGTTCRKLHRLAKSVIILDEAQTIPVELLAPTLAALRELKEHYGCSIVLCTATQPALERQTEFPIGIDAPRRIIAPERRLHERLKRVHILHDNELADEELVTRLARETSVLCIVNTRPHASTLYDRLTELAPKEECFHLSTWMCPIHRREVLAEMRARLKANRPCRVVSTQLIEAGVDVDFPVVYRAPAGFDSLAQAAGRCNREGTLRRDGRPVLGEVHLFDTATPPPNGLLRHAAQDTRELLTRFQDPLTPDAIEAYFRQIGLVPVMPALNELGQIHQPVPLQFREASRRYRLINDEGKHIVVPYNMEADSMIEQLQRQEEIDFRFLRRVQNYMISVSENVLRKLWDQNVLYEHPHPAGFYLLMNKSAYSSAKGLSLGAFGFDANFLVT
jgi:CRISPR-associated endonuclease/helicase Cas3